MSAEVFSATRCTLGEGPLWHPGRQQLFWFDILQNRLLTRAEGQEKQWQFDEHVSAAGWLSQDALLMASATGLWRFEIGTGARELVAPLEADIPGTRSNDGRADPWGGFWIGTMGVDAAPGAGAIYRYYRGALRRLYAGLSIPNAICFSPGHAHAYYTDTADGRILRQPLDGEGWPQGPAQVFVDLRGTGLAPDGAVVDAAGNLWNAQWGAHRVACYDPDGRLLHSVALPAKQTSCPAFGGADLRRLYVTSAAEGLTGAADGQTFALATAATGQAEHQVIL